MSEKRTEADRIKPKGIFCNERCPLLQGKLVPVRCDALGYKPSTICRPFVEIMGKSLRQVARYCKMVAEDGTPGDYGCGTESTAIAILDILDENNIAMEQLK